MPHNTLRVRLAWPIAIMASFAIISQYTLNVVKAVEPQAHIFFRFFGYFTIVTNLLVAIHFTVLAWPGGIRKYPFLTHPRNTSALATFITVVGLVYYTLLTDVWDPEGFQLVVDRLLHTFVPLATILYWLVATPKEGLRWTDPLRWLLVPFVYFLYFMLLGELIGKYPYPFFEVPELGYARVLFMALALLAFFALVGYTFLGLAKLMGRNKRG